MWSILILLQEALEMHVDMDSLIDIPKRPAWNYTLTKQKLLANEQEYFRVTFFSLYVIILMVWNFRVSFAELFPFYW